MPGIDAVVQHGDLDCEISLNQLPGLVGGGQLYRVLPRGVGALAARAALGGSIGRDIVKRGLDHQIDEVRLDIRQVFAWRQLLDRRQRIDIGRQGNRVLAEPAWRDRFIVHVLEQAADGGGRVFHAQQDPVCGQHPGFAQLEHGRRSCNAGRPVADRRVDGMAHRHGRRGRGFQ